MLRPPWEDPGPPPCFGTPKKTQMEKNKPPPSLPSARPPDPWLQDMYLQYGDKVYGYFFKKLQSSEEAEDLSSQVFLELTRHADRFDRVRASESTWIYIICRNLCNRHLRNKYTRHRIIKKYIHVREAPVPDPREIERLVLKDALADNLSKLNDEKRRILILSYYDGLSNREIASRLKITYTNVCVQKNRALKELKILFEK
jgi:RNA polymerase sigma-70 factor (ECF subfamily)